MDFDSAVKTINELLRENDWLHLIAHG